MRRRRIYTRSRRNAKPPDSFCEVASVRIGQARGAPGRSFGCLFLRRPNQSSNAMMETPNAMSHNMIIVVQNFGEELKRLVPTK